MFCACPVVDSTRAEPNTAVCPICAGFPGVLPVVNQKAVDYALRVALALGCEVASISEFARKNYFYPDLPKGYQISQYAFPLAQKGILPVRTSSGWLDVRIRRVHLEEDTGKLTHIQKSNGESCSLIDLNRAGIPLLEIVSEPDMHAVEQVRAYTHSLRRLLQYLGVNAGDLEKGVIRFEANVSVRPTGSTKLGTRVEIKNLNSFKTMTDAINYELVRQTALIENRKPVLQETLGWDEEKQITLSQRSKEEAHDYRYFPEPDLPPLKIESSWIDAVQKTLPERPDRRFHRFLVALGLNPDLAERLIANKDVADYFETTLSHMPDPDPTLAANWITGELFGLMNVHHQPITAIQVSPSALAALLHACQQGRINNATAKSILQEMFQKGVDPHQVIKERGLEQISDQAAIASIVRSVLDEHPEEVAAYQAGKTNLHEWFFGQVMQKTKGKANPTIVVSELKKQL